MNFFDFADILKEYTTEKFVDDIQVAVENNPYINQLQLQQWNEGKDAFGNILGVYSKATEIITDGRKKAGTLYDLFETGQTRRNTNILGTQANGDVVWYFDADAPAVPELIEKIGDRIFGLQTKNLSQFAAIAQDLATDLLNTNLKLK